jgi:hypothetical protein
MQHAKSHWHAFIDGHLIHCIGDLLIVYCLTTICQAGMALAQAAQFKAMSKVVTLSWPAKLRLGKAKSRKKMLKTNARIAIPF